MQRDNNSLKNIRTQEEEENEKKRWSYRKHRFGASFFCSCFSFYLMLNNDKTEEESREKPTIKQVDNTHQMYVYI